MRASLKTPFDLLLLPARMNPFGRGEGLRMRWSKARFLEMPMI